MLDLDFRHRKIAYICRGKGGTDTHCRRCNQTIRLMKRNAPPCERTPPSAIPSGAILKPLKSRCAFVASPSSKPRHISSTEIAQAHGSTPSRLSRITRAAAGRPRSTSISTVESKSRRAMVNQLKVCRHAVPDAPKQLGHRPTHGLCQANCQMRPQGFLGAARPQARGRSARQQTRYGGGNPPDGQVRPQAHHPRQPVCASVFSTSRTAKL